MGYCIAIPAAPCGTQSMANAFALARSRHPGGVNATLADGSVRFVSDTISPSTWLALGTRGSERSRTSEKDDSMKLYNVLTPAMAGCVPAACGLQGFDDRGVRNGAGRRATARGRRAIFEEADQSTGPAVAKVTAGKYALRMTPGSKKVRITASRPTSTPDPLMGTAAREMMIPAEFNESSRLTVEIRSGRQTGVDFQVTTIPPAPGPK